MIGELRKIITILLCNVEQKQYNADLKPNKMTHGHWPSEQKEKATNYIPVYAVFDCI